MLGISTNDVIYDLVPVALYAGAVDEARRLNRRISVIGDHGIPIRDEIELELRLT